METATAPRSNPWVVLATLLVIYIFNFADRYLLTGLVGPIKEEFGIGDNVMGLLMGPAFVMLYIVMGVPFARLADRKSRIRIIAAGCVMWSLATAATGLATGPWSLALARVGVGVGEAAFVAWRVRQVENSLTDSLVEIFETRDDGFDLVADQIVVRCGLHRLAGKVLASLEHLHDLVFDQRALRVVLA